MRVYPSTSFSLGTVLFSFCLGKLCLKLTKTVTISTILMTLFGYPYSDDLVIIICKDSPEYLHVVNQNKKLNCAIALTMTQAFGIASSSSK